MDVSGINTRLSRKNSSTNLHTNILDTSKNYTVDKTQALQKKKDSCNKEHMTARMKAGNNFVIVFSTAAYELAKQKTIEIWERNESTYKFTLRKGVDNQGACIDNCIKVYNKKSDGTQGKLLKFVINFYQTSSVANANGSRIDLFLSDIYPKLCDAMEKSCKDLTIINDNIYASLDMGSQHSESTTDKALPSSDLKTIKSASTCMSTWNDKDDSFISLSVHVIDYSDQTEKDDICPLCSKQME